MAIARAFFVLSLFAAAVSFAAVPQLINYQGTLTNPSGSPLDTTVSLSFTLYDAAVGGASLWTEVHPTVVATDGLFHATLGEVTVLPDSILNHTEVWLGVTAGGDSEMTPRTRVSSAAYAYRVATLDGAKGGVITGDISLGRGQVRVGNWNFVSGDSNQVYGNYATISGKRNKSTQNGNVISGGLDNVIDGDGLLLTDTGLLAAIGGGQNNRARGNFSVVSGGGGPTALTDSNSAQGTYSAISGGRGNLITHSGIGANIGGGRSNLASDSNATVGGGSNNRARGRYAVVAGGGGAAASDSNSASGQHSVVSGGQSNSAGANIATISGGYGNMATGIGSTVSGGGGNDATGEGSAVNGGYTNTAAGYLSTISGGEFNSSNGTAATLGGGQYNAAFEAYTTIGGGQSNHAADSGATIVGGHANIASGFDAFVGGGGYNRARGDFSVVVGGGGRQESDSNSARSPWATVSGGTRNSAYTYSTVGGGINNAANGVSATIGGGESNSANGSRATVPGGEGNQASGAYSFAAGRRANAQHDGSFVWGDATDADFASTAGSQFLIRSAGGVGIGMNNPAEQLEVNGDVKADTFRADAGIRFPDGSVQISAGVSNGQQFADTTTWDATRTWVQSSGYLRGSSNLISSTGFVGGGDNNKSRGANSVVAGGGGAAAIDSNSAIGVSSTIGGGLRNHVPATGVAATVGGGMYNRARGEYSVVAGGGGNVAIDSNYAGSSYSAVGGGSRNYTGGAYATIPGGFNNFAAGDYSFAAGSLANANHTGSFVWNDRSALVLFASTAANQFNIRAAGGTRIFSNSTATLGAQLVAGATAWTALCDSTKKDRYGRVDTKLVLEKLSQIPIETWSYKEDPNHITHMGPMAQDFYTAFELGESDTTISTLDPDGVALAAIQELAKQISELKNENRELRARMDQIAPVKMSSAE